MKYIKSLYAQVIFGIIVGIFIGIYFPSFAIQLNPPGDAFIKLVKMMIAPIIFCTTINGIAGMENTKKVGKVGIKAIIYFEIVTTFALMIGLLIVNILKPGVGMNIDSATLDMKAVEAYATPHKSQGVLEFIMNIIPDNIINALSAGNILQILLFSILLGFASSKIGSKAKPFLVGLKSIEEALFAFIKIVMRVAPLGVLGAMSFTIGKYGLGSLVSLGQLMGSFYLTCALFIILICGGILKYTGFNLFRLLAYIKEELLIVIGPSSSEAALPSIMDKLRKPGLSKPVVGLIIPSG